VIRKEAWSFYRTISGVRLCWELEETKGPNGRTADALSLWRDKWTAPSGPLSQEAAAVLEVLEVLFTLTLGRHWS